MKPWLRLTLLGVVAYLVFLVATVPAAPFLGLLAPPERGVRLAGVSGTLWSGEAVAIRTPVVALQEVEWSLKPLALLTGALEFSLSGRLGNEPLSADAGVSLWGGRWLSDVQGRMPANDIVQRAGVPQVQLSGLLDFDLEEVRWIDAPWPLIEGVLSWQPASLVNPVELDLGTVTLTAGVVDDITIGDLNASGGPLQVQGKLTLNPDGAYALDAQLRKQGDVPPEVDQFLSTFTEFRDGAYRLEWSDQL